MICDRTEAAELRLLAKARQACEHLLEVLEAEPLQVGSEWRVQYGDGTEAMRRVTGVVDAELHVTMTFVLTGKVSTIDTTCYCKI